MSVLDASTPQRILNTGNLLYMECVPYKIIINREDLQGIDYGGSSIGYDTGQRYHCPINKLSGEYMT